MRDAQLGVPSRAAVQTERERLDRRLDKELHRGRVARVWVALVARREGAEPAGGHQRTSLTRRATRKTEERDALGVVELVLGLGGRLGDALRVRGQSA